MAKPFCALFVTALLLIPLVPRASEGDHLEPAYTNLHDPTSLQRGAALFVNYCSGCHSLKYQRYSRMAADLGLTEAQVTEKLNFTNAKFGETMQVAMNPDNGTAWFGKAPPDLSLTARARGADWIYNYLKSFYIDEARPIGWNNKLFPGASMPNVLWDLQGVQRPVYGAVAEGGGQPPIEHLELVTPGRLNPEQYGRVARDITVFLQYVGEPAALQREAHGIWVILYLAAFTFLAWLLKREYWRDIH